MKTNIKEKSPTPVTHEGAPASRIGKLAELRRSVMSCLLFEKQFYESGEDVAERIKRLIPLVAADKVADLAVEARTRGGLRHAPLLMVSEMVRHASHRPFVANALERIIQRADEPGEFLSLLYGAKGRTFMVPRQVKLGLGRALAKFDEYQLAKYDRVDDAYRLRDVMFLTHAKPKLSEREGKATKAKPVSRKGYTRGETLRHQKALFTKLEPKKSTLETPETWETMLSAAGRDPAKRKHVWEHLLLETKTLDNGNVVPALGDLALLRNLRNMLDCGVDRELIVQSGAERKFRRIFPFQFISAAKMVPELESVIEPWMLQAASTFDKLAGPTALLVDHSGSMRNPLSQRDGAARHAAASGRSYEPVTNFDAAAAVGILLRELAGQDEFRVFTFSESCIEVPARRGFALREAIMSRINPTSTYLGRAVKHVYTHFPSCERLIVITDEQSADKPGKPQGTGYVVNVAAHRSGVGYGDWLHIDGFSASVLDYIRAYETGEL